MSEVKIRAKTVIKLETPRMSLTATYVKGTSLSTVVRYLISLLLIDTSKGDVQKLLDREIELLEVRKR